jgi:hypothetical protein
VGGSGTARRFGSSASHFMMRTAGFAFFASKPAASATYVTVLGPALSIAAGEYIQGC